MWWGIACPAASRQTQQPPGGWLAWLQLPSILELCWLTLHPQGQLSVCEDSWQWKGAVSMVSRACCVWSTLGLDDATRLLIPGGTCFCAGTTGAWWSAGLQPCSLPSSCSQGLTYGAVPPPCSRYAAAPPAAHQPTRWLPFPFRLVVPPGTALCAFVRVDLSSDMLGQCLCCRIPPTCTHGASSPAFHCSAWEVLRAAPAIVNRCLALALQDSQPQPRLLQRWCVHVSCLPGAKLAAQPLSR